MREFLQAIWDGPLRTRVFWLIVFVSIVDFTQSYCVEFASLCVDLASYQTIVEQILNALVLVGVLHATRHTTPVDDTDAGWRRKHPDV